MGYMTVPTLRGPRVTLRAAGPDDEQARRAYGWHRDIERNYGHEHASGEMTLQEAHEWYQEQLRLAEDPTGRYWVIEADGELAGVVFLHSISDTDQRARFAIGMFAPELVGRGLGSEATRLVLEHAFGPIGLHRVDLRVLAFNEAAISSYRGCGFVEEGRERESCWLGGAWHDDVIMGVLSSEYTART